jgi:hypothetical protein
VRFSAEVLAEVRRQLALEPAAADVLATVIAEWGQQAVAAAPELLAALLGGSPRVATALLALGRDEPAALGHLQRLVETDGSVAAALAIWRIAGDSTPVLDMLRTWLSGGGRVPRDDRSAMTAVSGFGDLLSPLVPVAQPHLTGTAAPTFPQRELQVLASRVVAAAGDAQSITPTLRAVLAGGNTPARTAAELVADLAQTHPSLATEVEPQLWDRLDDRWSRLAAARALARLGTPPAQLTTALVNGLTDYAGRFGVATILEVRAVDTVPALEELLASDRRFVASGLADDIVWADEILQDRVRAAIAELRA